MAKLSLILVLATTLSIVLAYWLSRLPGIENDHLWWQWAVGLSILTVSTIVKPEFLIHLIMNLIGGSLIGFSLSGDFSPSRGNAKFESEIQISSTFWILVVVCLSGLVVLLRAPSIFDYGLRWDEHWHLSTTLGYLQEGEFTTWDFRRGTATEGSYLRAWLYTWQVALLTRWLRNPLYSARIISFFWGILSLVPFYLLLMRVRSSRLWIGLGIIWFAFSPHLITVSRWGRFYSFFLLCYLFLVYFLFRFLVDDGPVNRVLNGTLAVLFFVLGCHLNPLTLLVIPALFAYLAYEILVASNLALPVTEFRYDYFLLGLAGFCMLLILFIPYLDEFIIQPNITVKKLITGEGRFVRVGTGSLTDSISFIPQFYYRYLIYFFQDHLGYGFGALLLSSVAIPGLWDREIERYLYCMIFVPVFMIIFFTNRTPQVRYVIQFIAISIPLSISLLSKFPVSEWDLDLGPTLLLILIIISLILYEFPARARYIYSGNYGYIHSPGVKTPKYRSALRWLDRSANSGQFVHFYYWNYFYYVHPFYRIQFEHDHASFRRFTEETRIRHRIERVGQERDGVWVVYPEILRELITRKDRYFLRRRCGTRNVPDDWYIQVYFCE